MLFYYLSLPPLSVMDLASVWVRNIKATLWMIHDLEGFKLFVWSLHYRLRWPFLHRKKSTYLDNKIYQKGCLPIAKLKKYKLESSDLGATWAIWLPTYVDSKTQLTPKSDNVNKQKFMRSAWVMSELWTMALNNMHPWQLWPLWTLRPLWWDLGRKNISSLQFSLFTNKVGGRVWPGLPVIFFTQEQNVKNKSCLNMPKERQANTLEIICWFRHFVTPTPVFSHFKKFTFTFYKQCG